MQFPHRQVLPRSKWPSPPDAHDAIFDSDKRPTWLPNRRNLKIPDVFDQGFPLVDEAAIFSDRERFFD